MTAFRWLHLTDLHLGMHAHDWLWPGVKDRFYEDLKKLHDRCGPWDVILFTGDLTQQGKPKEFDRVDAWLAELLAHVHALGSTPLFLAVPGNHDLARQKTNDPAVKLLQQWDTQADVRAEFWESKSSPYRKVLAKAFRSYTTWWSGRTGSLPSYSAGMLPGDFSISLEKDGAMFGIVGLNTAFLQLTGDNYEGKLGLHVRQFHAACGGDGIAWAKRHHACLLLTHHPPVWLNPESQQHLKGEIADHSRFGAHLCGHKHVAAACDISEGGGDPRHIWQGRSLFGLEHFGEQQERSHGYSAGSIALSNEHGTLMFWPRESRLQGSQRNIVPDYSLHLTDAQHTPPQEIPLVQAYQRNARQASSSHAPDVDETPESSHQPQPESAMKTLSATLQQEILDFLTSLPSIHGTSSQQAFINRAGLDSQLHNHIDFSGSVAQFFDLLVPQLVRYDELADGRHALEAVLESAKGYVGPNRQKVCDGLIERARKELRGRDPASSPQHVDFETLLGWLNKLVEAEFSIMMNSLLSVEQQNVLTQPAHRGNFLGDMQRWGRLQEITDYLHRKYPERFSG